MPNTPESKTIDCVCGKELIVLEGNIITELCTTCPLKLSDFYICFRRSHKHYLKFVHIRARNREDASRKFYREYPGGFGKLFIHRGSIPKKYSQLGETMIVKYSKDQLETIPGDPKNKRKPRRRK